MTDLSSAPLIDELDHQILMHRDVHFSGSFPVMCDYYAKEGKGIRPEITPERIAELQFIEEQYGANFSDEILFDQEKEEIAYAKEKYLSLKSVYSDQGNLLSHLIADLIFSEEEDVSQEIAAIVSLGEKAVVPLIDLLTSDDFFNPLFPGYGEAPALAARCLGHIGDERAIRPLFSALGHEDFFMEEAIFDALSSIGDKAKAFLLNVLKMMPVTKENERAAIALIGFKDDPEIAKVCLQMLKSEQNINKPTFAAYLIMGCYGLNELRDQEDFIQISQQHPVSGDLKQEMDVIIQKWKKIRCFPPLFTT